MPKFDTVSDVEAYLAFRAVVDAFTGNLQQRFAAFEREFQQELSKILTEQRLRDQMAGGRRWIK